MGRRLRKPAVYERSRTAATPPEALSHYLQSILPCTHHISSYIRPDWLHIRWPGLLAIDHSRQDGLLGLLGNRAGAGTLYQLLAIA